jgi:hypothetical protein
VLSPTDELPIQQDGFPRSAGRRELRISGAMSGMVRHGFHPAADPDPQGRG